LQDFLELAVSATASGCVYGLIALAYLLMIRPTGIINFAVGEWAMVAAFGGHLLLSRVKIASHECHGIGLLSASAVGRAHGINSAEGPFS